MGTKVLPEQKVRALLTEGMTPSEVAAALFDQDHIDVTPEAVSMFRLRNTDVERSKVDHSELIPWEIKKLSHRHKTAVQRLRAEGRRRAGKKLTARDAHALELWLQNMKDMDVVVHYDGASEQGWFYVPRRAGIDLDLIRDPYLTDSGQPQSKAAQHKAGLRVIKGSGSND